MGWLELLPLLKRLLPLLSRIAPMLETYVATRGATRTETAGTALDRIAGDVRGDLATSAEKHASLSESLAAQAAQTGAIAVDLSKLRSSDERNAARILQIETEVAQLSGMLRKVTILLAALLVACIGLLIALLLRRG